MATPSQPPRLVIDLSNTIATSRTSGLQRVATSLTSELNKTHETLIVDARSGKLRPLSPTASYRLDRVEAGRPVGRSWIGRLENRAMSSIPIRRQWRPGPGDIFIDLEPSWYSLVSRSALLPRLAAKGVPTFALVPDLLAINHPEWFPPESAVRFRSWLEAHRDAGSHFLAISHATADSLRTWLDRDLSIPVVRLGVDHRPHDVTENRGAGILMLGTVEPRKGHDVLLDALDELGDDAPVVDVVGQPGWASPQLTARLDAHSSVRWHRYLSDQDLADLWALTGLLLQPTRGEGFGLPVAEALHRNVLVLASDLPVLRESGGEAASYVAVADTAAWAAGIAAFETDPESLAGPRSALLHTWADGANDVWAAVTEQLSRQQ